VTPLILGGSIRPDPLGGAKAPRLPRLAPDCRGWGPRLLRLGGAAFAFDLP